MAQDQVLVRVHATSVNPVDCYVRSGGLRRFKAVPFPIVPGVDISGTVERCGKRVRRFSPGDQVFAFLPRCRGASAEFAVCEESWLATKPAVLSHIEAAVVPCVGLTALQALRDKLELTSGQTVLIVGASGGVGTMAVQVACAMAVEVTAVCSTANIDQVKRIGATHVVDYKMSDVFGESRQFDAVFDCVGIHRFWVYQKLLSKRGKHVGISCSWRSRVDCVLSWIVSGQTSFQFHVQAKHKDLEHLAELIDQGKLKPVVSRIYPLAEIVGAHQACETRHTVGKIAVQIV